ncbi:MAG: polymer-forming cytoskeletal protein [Chromatiales bacterium]|nr:polymer-forming cytoskeletal protein [Chromatiales bacterium]
MFERTKKPGDPVETPASSYQPPASSSATDSAPRPAAGPATSTSRARTTAVIGPSIQIEGTLRGQEDVFVEGEVTGTIQLQSNTLTIGTSGKIKADVYAHTVFVEGSMDGDLFGSEQVIIRKSARVRGNITSPRVTLEDGAAFKGSIEMDPESVKNVLGTAASANRGPAPARPASAPQPVAGAASISNLGGQSR